MGIDSCLKIAKLTAAAGEMAPFPFIKGAAQCVVLVLEVIESAGKNEKDLQELAERIVATLVVVRDTAIKHGPTSASCFKDVCLDFQTHMIDLHSKLNSGCRDQRGIWQYLRAKKVSDDINNLRQRVQAIQDSFLIRTTTMTQFALCDVHNDITTGFSTLTGSVEASERNITSTIKDGIEEICTLGARQSEDMQNLAARLQGSRQRGLYKGSVWDIIPGDIHIIEPVTRSLTKCRVVRYQDSYCTIENSDTRKVIRKYQASSDREDAMEQLDQALDFFMKQGHPNLPQIFGVCRSPDLPAIIFLLHGTTRVPYSRYIDGLSATRFVKFYFDLFQDLQSVSEDLPMESYRYSGDRLYSVYGLVSEIANDFLCVIIVLKNNEEEQVYVNKYGKLVFGDLLCYTHYYLGPFDLSYTQDHGRYSLRRGTGSRASPKLLHSQASKWMLSSSSRKEDLQTRYEVIAFGHDRSAGNVMSWTQTFDRHRLQPPQYKLNGRPDPAYRCPDPKFYAPGSILCNLQDLFSPRRVLVGRARPPPHGWKWDISLRKGSSWEEVVNLSFDNGSVSIKLSWDDVIRNSMISIHTCSEDSDEIVKSWIAQTSKLDSCLRSRGYAGNLEACIAEDVYFDILFSPKEGEDNNFCHICNAKDRSHHALSLSITAPITDYDTNTIKSLPTVSCSRVCGMDSLKEEDIFTIRVEGDELQTKWGWLLKHTVRSTIPELNAEHGFDPARDGADVCEYFGWPLLEILDSSTGEWILNGTTSQSSGPASVIPDNTSPILSQAHDSAPYSTDVATGSIQEAQAEVPTKTEIVPVVQHDISTRALIIIFIAISVQVILLSSFKNYL
ncbi:uncharacterized protein ARMOST_15890 [Armillaria ostoyae]|uniref:Uncharacterized protein n=1 Tax=Armillaria ostoyae TaxID=47428 RepID=A0A284RUN8_ARMOS|nr:uncharacterized protein ARMOST_15890 [Armillaria ostoyae]